MLKKKTFNISVGQDMKKPQLACALSGDAANPYNLLKKEFADAFHSHGSRNLISKNFS